ncbi:Gag-Pol polyprotein [Plecturocebus cupreus]
MVDFTRHKDCDPRDSRMGSRQTKLTKLLRARYHIPHLHKFVRETTARCDVCARHVAINISFVFVNTFSEWVKAFPAKTETALVMTKKLLQNLVPRFGLSLTLGSDNSPAFIAQVSQGLAKALGIS